LIRITSSAFTETIVIIIIIIIIIINKQFCGLHARLNAGIVMYLKIRLLTIRCSYTVESDYPQIDDQSEQRKRKRQRESIYCALKTLHCAVNIIPGQRAERATNLSLRRRRRRRLVHSFHCSFIRQNPHVLLYIIYTLYMYIIKKIT